MHDDLLLFCKRSYIKIGFTCSFAHTLFTTHSFHMTDWKPLPDVR